MQRRTPFLLNALTGALLLTLTALTPPAYSKDATPAAAAAAAAGTSASDKTSPSDSDANLQEKLNLYIDCYNGADASFRGSIQRYASWVQNMNTGPTGRERLVYGLYNVSGVEQCQKNITQANAMQPPMPGMEKAASAYVASLAPLQDTIRQAYTYYERENYKDDGFAKGKALHKPLAEQAKAFDAASRQFSDALDEANDAQQQAQLQQMEKQNGRDFAYYRLSVMVQAKQLTRLLMQDKVDIAKVGELLDTFENSVDAMSKAPGNDQQPRSSQQLRSSLYGGSVESFRNAAKAYYRRLRDKTPYSNGDKSLLGTAGGWMVKGSPDAMLQSYNRMVDESNRLNR